MTVFVDTSAWYAAVDADDVHHQRATRLLGAGEPLATSDHVLAECWTLLRARVGRAVAERFFAAVRGGAARLDFVAPVDVEAAWAIRQSCPDQDFSLVDRTSFALVERLGLQRVASFDHDFLVYRYGRDRRRAFEVLR